MNEDAEPQRTATADELKRSLHVAGTLVSDLLGKFDKSSPSSLRSEEIHSYLRELEQALLPEAGKFAPAFAARLEAALGRQSAAVITSSQAERADTLQKAVRSVHPEAEADLTAIEKAVFGESGAIKETLRTMGALTMQDRPAIGRIANALKQQVESQIREHRHRFASEPDLDSERLDMSAPGRPVAVGHHHPVQTMMRDLREIFHAYGFEVFEGPEIETEEYNFELLNIPPDHPARDLWDTLFVAEPGSVEAGRPEPARDGTILRTHTSPVQMRAMQALDAPIRVITPGRCFRYEAVDAGHGFEFFQVEGLVVDRETSLADLKGMLEEVARALYGRDVRTRFRPGYYPFTEPSVAFDIGCLVCGGKGCPACKRSGWMTILGAGMVHPTVLRNGGFDPAEYQGYAFGMGPDRMTMLRHGIGDIRLFFSADLRFLSQFGGGT